MAAEPAEAAAALLAMAVKQRGAIRIGGDWLCESAVMQAVAIARGRCIEAGKRVAVRGGVFWPPDPPPLPEADVAILLEATAYPDLGAWLSPPKNQITLLVGRIEEWSVRPELVLERPGYDDVLKPYRDRFRAHWESAGNDDRELIRIAAMGVDLPAGAVASGGVVFPEVQTLDGEPLPWHSLEGPWLATHVLREICGCPAAASLMARLRTYPQVANRLANRVAKYAASEPEFFRAPP